MINNSLISVVFQITRIVVFILHINYLQIGKYVIHYKFTFYYLFYRDRMNKSTLKFHHLQYSI